MKDIFIITSVIRPNTQQGWTYTSIRSTFSPKERFEQTQSTINSIRKYCGNAKILLVECSQLEIDEHEYFAKNVDYFMNLFDDPIINQAVNSVYKGLGEVYQCLWAIDFIKDLNNIRNIYKISGRYILTQKFDINKFSTDIPTFLKYADGHCTVLYSISNNKFIEYEMSLHKIKNMFNGYVGIEQLLGNILNQSTPIHPIDELGVCGYVAVDNGGLLWEK